MRYLVLISAVVLSCNVFAMTDDEAAKCDANQLAGSFQKATDFIQANPGLIFGVADRFKSKAETLANSSTSCDDLAKNLNKFSEEFVAAGTAFLNVFN